MKAKLLIEQVHRRSVWQLLAIYVGGSFSVVGNAELLTGTFGFPAWLLPGSLVLLATGIIGMFGVKLWPRLSKPTPRAKRAGTVGLSYLAGGFAVLGVLGLLMEQVQSIPRQTFDAVLAAYLLFLPVAMVVGYFRRKRLGTSDGWVYSRLKPGWAGGWVFDQLVEQGLSVDDALAKIETAAEQIEQDTGKRPPGGPSAKRVQRRRDAEQKDNA